MKTPILALIGFMGAGKTTVGQRLAQRRGLPFVDLDQQIADVAGRTIPEIFEQEGENGFRARERQALRAVLDGSEKVLAAGGGTVIDVDNRRRLRQSSFVVWLDIRLETARTRLRADGESLRPLIGQSGWEGLARLLDQRRPDYAAASHLRLEADARPPTDLARRIEALWDASEAAVEAPS